MIKNLRNKIQIWAAIILIVSCAPVEQTSKSKHLKISVLAGTNFGGITENTDMAVLADTQVDAYTGATNAGLNVGVHLNYAVKNNQIETGIDYLYSNQIFSYSDVGNNFIGDRKLMLSQMMIPLSYNFVLFKNSLPKSDVQLKLGLLGQLNFLTTDDTGNLPDFSLNRFSGGLVFGISAFPVKFENGDKLGLYFDGYRGSQIYADYYNQSSFEMPGSSFIKFGLKYQFN
ncbi:MAG: hypothetical protein P1P88_04180 [Bacteroidales bacterium]|nr:hypothetical protein [Bacteroidales bacterium]